MTLFTLSEAPTLPSFACCTITCDRFLSTTADSAGTTMSCSLPPRCAGGAPTSAVRLSFCAFVFLDRPLLPLLLLPLRFLLCLDRWLLGWLPRRSPSFRSSNSISAESSYSRTSDSPFFFSWDLACSLAWRLSSSVFGDWSYASDSGKLPSFATFCSSYYCLLSSTIDCSSASSSISSSLLSQPLLELGPSSSLLSSLSERACARSSRHC